MVEQLLYFLDVYKLVSEEAWGKRMQVERSARSSSGQALALTLKLVLSFSFTFRFSLPDKSAVRWSLAWSVEWSSELDSGLTCFRQEQSARARIVGWNGRVLLTKIFRGREVKTCIQRLTSGHVDPH